MQARTIEDVSSELREEGHDPMVRFVLELGHQPWAEGLIFDLSMLRLWVARQGMACVEVMVTYGDGRMGGRPRNMHLDAFDLTIFRDGEQEEISALNMREAIDRIRSWLEVMRQ